MSKNRLFPENVIKQSADYLFFTYNKNTQILYLVIIAVVIAAFISLFYIKIDIGVGVNGMIKPKGERVMITSPSVGRLSLKNVSENKKVEEGDTLFVIIADNISSQQNALISRKNDLKSMLRDLTILSKHKIDEKENMTSGQYRKSYSYYISQRLELELKKDAIEKNYNRDKKLVENKVLSAYDFETIKAQYNSAKAAIQIHDDRQFAQWQNEKDNYEVELREIDTKLLQIDIANREMVICSPASGVIQTIMNVNDGSYRSANC